MFWGINVNVVVIGIGSIFEVIGVIRGYRKRDDKE